jgi:hypothetical protein
MPVATTEPELNNHCARVKQPQLSIPMIILQVLPHTRFRTEGFHEAKNKNNG